MSKRYYKGLDENLCGKNQFQYAIGCQFTADTDDAWSWLYFAKKATTAIQYGPRVVEVEPVTFVQRFGTNEDMCAKTIRIIRELPREELLQKLVDEKCSFSLMLCLKPTYEELVRYRSYIKRRDYFEIFCGFSWLTENEKLNLLPKSWGNRIHAYYEDLKVKQERRITGGCDG